MDWRAHHYIVMLGNEHNLMSQILPNASKSRAIANIPTALHQPRFVGTARNFCGLFHCVGDDTLCGLVGLDSRLSKLLLARSSVGVDCAFAGRRFDALVSSFIDLPSSDKCSIS